MRLSWPNGLRYIDYNNIPTDAGFVAMLMHMPELRVFKTGVRLYYTLKIFHLVNILMVKIP